MNSDIEDYLSSYTTSQDSLSDDGKHPIKYTL